MGGGETVKAPVPSFLTKCHKAINRGVFIKSALSSEEDKAFKLEMPEFA